MSIQSTVEQKLSDALIPQFLRVVNESHTHNVPENSETHFNVVVVSAVFDGKRRVARHQLVYALLKEELAGPIHALALHTYTADEWQAVGGAAPVSPDCMGGGK